jgi:hypothetical protein
MRKTIFWLGMAILCALPFAYAFEIYSTQDIPGVAIWKWGILVGAIALVIAGRNRDDVLKHRVA